MPFLKDINTYERHTRTKQAKEYFENILRGQQLLYQSKATCLNPVETHIQWLTP